MLRTLAFLAALLCARPATPEDATWVQREGEVYGAQADASGPIGGGQGYARIAAKGDFTVSDLDGLLKALGQAKAGQVVFIPGDAEIDCTARVYCFDMHGGRDRKDGTDVAGTTILIHHNTFRAPERAVVIRGVPEDACRVFRNWFPKHAGPGAAVQAAAKTFVSDNAYGADPPRIVK